MDNKGLERINRMLEMAHTDAAVFPSTDLYNESWMLRIVLSTQSEVTECLPFAFQPGARWFSEALIASPFLPRFRGDPLSERHTHLDGVIGHFDIRSGTRTGFELTADSTQFVVTEAKMFSRLSKGTKNAPYYDQAVRTIACMAWATRQSNRFASDFESLGFYVIAPDEQISAGVYSSQLKKSSIREKVNRRVSVYENDDYDKHDELQIWYKGFFIPVLERIDIDCISWKSIIDRIDNPSIEEFYDRCLEFNRQAKTKR
jgi:hypothetical protein